jgi:acyl dehydratase
MGKAIIGNFEEFEQYKGKTIGISDYFRITQDQINKFADATLDHQWIHTDPTRAAIESPFKTAIAHGYLTLSLIPYFWEQIADVRNLRMMINYGIESLRFNQPVPVNSEVRMRVDMLNIINLRGVTKVELEVTLEIKDNAKPAFSGTLVFLYHFNSK